MIDSNYSHGRFLAGSLFRRSALLVLAALLSAALFPLHAQVNSVAQKKVLVLHLMRRNDTSTLANERTYQRVLTDGLAGRLDYYSEYVDLARFGADDYQSALRDFLKQKYKGTDFNLILAATGDLRNFLTRYGAELFPKTPVVFSAGDDPNDT